MYNRSMFLKRTFSLKPQLPAFFLRMILISLAPVTSSLLYIQETKKYSQIRACSYY